MTSLRLPALIALVFMTTACSVARNDEHVGSRDCDVIAESVNDPATATACEDCNGVACDDASSACEEFPCVDGKVVIQGCITDTDCAEFGEYYCGSGPGPDDICSSVLYDF